MVSSTIKAITCLSTADSVNLSPPLAEQQHVQILRIVATDLFHEHSNSNYKIQHENNAGSWYLYGLPLLSFASLSPVN